MLFSSHRAQADDEVAATEYLVTETGAASEYVLEAFLSPAEFSGRRFIYESAGDEALFAIDASLSAKTPVIELHPERVSWPMLSNLQLTIEKSALALRPSPGLSDAALDSGFKIQWTLEALGQRFSTTPSFLARVVSAKIVSLTDGRTLAEWSAPKSPPVCRKDSRKDTPRCRLDIGFEVRAVSLSPDGRRLSLALGGLRPRIELYDIRHTPRLLWQAIFTKGSGGVVETAFSSDGEWVTALTGQGVMHRFDSKSGGKHLAVESSGLAALAVPPGRIIAVAGTSGEVTLWYLADGTIARRFPPRNNRGTVDKLAASGNGEIIATLEYTDLKSIIRVWAVENRALLRQIEVEGRTVSAIAIDELGKTIFASHEHNGLLSAPIFNKKSMSPVTGKAASRCTGRIEWIPKQSVLICSTKEGLLQLSASGAVKGILKIDEAASDWVTASSPGGSRIAAAGGGRLLLWWTD